MPGEHTRPSETGSPWGVLPWVGRGIASVLDQGAASLAALALAVALGRTAGGDEYGSFGVVASIQMLALQLYGAALWEPLLLFGAQRYRDRSREYLAVVLALNLGTSLVLATGLLLAAATSPAIQGPLLGLAAAQPVLSTLLVLRRASQLDDSQAGAAAAATAQLGLLLVLLLLAAHAGGLTATTAFPLAALAALAPIAFLWRRRAPRLAGVLDSRLVRDVLGQHWGYARWAILGAPLRWAPRNLFLVLLPAYAGYAAGGRLLALLIMIAPALQALYALSNVLLPAYAREGRVWGVGGFLRRALPPLVGGALGYAAILAVAPDLWLRLVFGPAFADLGQELRIVAVAPVLVATSVVLNVVLLSAGRYRGVFLAFLAAASFSLLFGMLALPLAGLRGAAWGTVGSLATLVAAMTILVMRVQAVQR